MLYTWFVTKIDFTLVKTPAEAKFLVSLTSLISKTMRHNNIEKILFLQKLVYLNDDVIFMSPIFFLQAVIMRTDKF